MTPPVSPARLAPWRRFFPTYRRCKAYFKREINASFEAYRSSSAEAFLTNSIPNYTSAAGWAARLSPSPMMTSTARSRVAFDILSRSLSPIIVYFVSEMLTVGLIFS